MPDRQRQIDNTRKDETMDRKNRKRISHIEQITERYKGHKGRKTQGQT